MKRHFAAIAVSVMLGLAPPAVHAQSNPGLRFGQVPTAAQWNSYFSAKQDVLGYTPVNRAGDTMQGPLTLVAPNTLRSGLNLACGTSPATPVDGDFWCTTAGLFIRTGGVTFGPFASGSVSSVGLALPGSVFTVSGSPVTGAGTLTGAFANQSPNTVFAGPAGGAPGSPGFRALSSADLPNANAASIDAGQLPYPTYADIGGVRAIAPVAHQWINSISLFGVPALSQPTCSDISDASAACSSGITALTSDVTATGPGSAAATIAAAAVTYAKIQNLGALSVMGRSANSTGVGANIQATASSDAVLRESAGTIGFGTIATAGIANNAVTLAKLATQAANTVLGNATAGAAVPTALAVGSCSTAASALQWTTNTGFGCNTSITAAAVPVGGITSLGTGVATFLGTPSSANLAAALTDETGTGPAVFATLPTLTSVILSTGLIYPSADSTTALKITKADGATALVTFNTSTTRVTFNDATQGGSLATQPVVLLGGLGVTKNAYFGAAIDIVGSLTLHGWLTGPAGDNAFSVIGSTTYFQQPASGDMHFRKSDGTDYMVINNDGTINMNALSASAQANALCYNSSTKLVTYNSGVTTCTASMASAKDLLGPVSPEDATRVVMQMRPWRYTYKTDFPATRGEQVGFVGDEVALVDERLVARDHRGAVSGVRYEQYTALLTAAFQNLKAANENIKAENDSLRARLDAIERQVGGYR